MEAVTTPLAYASPWRRLLAAVIDNFVVSFVTTFFGAGASEGFAQALVEGTRPEAGDVAWLTVVTVLVIVVYSTAMHAWRGATFGKMAARIVLVNDDGTKVSAATAFVRAVALAAIFFVSTLALSLPILINHLWPLWQRKRQTWHDMIARTVVLSGDAPAPHNFSSPPDG